MPKITKLHLHTTFVKVIQTKNNWLLFFWTRSFSSAGRC